MFKAEIVADSINQHGDRLTSVLVTFPRIILAEINTHRMLSKNTSSHRAIPFKKMVEAVQNNPFIPIAWQKHHSGMQGTEYFTDKIDLQALEQNWLLARDRAVQTASWLYECKLTKQLCNRLLEPFMWTTMLITGSKEGWDIFFELRCPVYKSDYGVFKSKKDVIKNDPERYKGIPDLHWLKINKGQAEIHMMDLAEKIYDAMKESTPKQLESGQWHIPFEDKIDYIKLGEASAQHYIDNPTEIVDVSKWAVKVSTAMAARTSYTVIGDEKEVDYKKMIELHDRLIELNHRSPLEHCCLCVSEEEYNNSFKGQEKGWFRNYKGFKSYRQIIEE